MGKEIIKLAPSDLWKHFYALTQIARPSKYEAEVINYIKIFSESINLPYTIDEVGNIIVSKPASKGKEHMPGVILQSHVDMVPQKNSSKEHDFVKDSIETIIEGDWLKANDTTLGADNGIGCAAMLAILEASDISHGPIEALFTINEEAGMEGAFGLKAGLLTGKILINLDSEDEGELFVGCAGGLNVETSTSYKVETISKGVAYSVAFSGLRGGHSGLDIALGRGNSNKLLGRFLWSALSNMPLRIAFLKGGDLRNAIPREASAVVVVPCELENDFKSFVEHFANNSKLELKHTEPAFQIELLPVELPSEVIVESDAVNLIGVLNASPNGMIRMSDDMPGIVETSLNLAIVKMINGTAEFVYLIRSSIDSAKYSLGEQVTALHKIMGWDIKYSGDYPGWRPDLNSKVLKICSDTYERLYNKKPGLLAIHAGLECGIIAGKYAGLDMVSFGPTIRFPHSPDEKVHIKSVEKFFDFLKETLENVS